MRRGDLAPETVLAPYVGRFDCAVLFVLPQACPPAVRLLPAHVYFFASPCLVELKSDCYDYQSRTSMAQSRTALTSVVSKW